MLILNINISKFKEFLKLSDWYEWIFWLYKESIEIVTG